MPWWAWLIPFAVFFVWWVLDDLFGPEIKSIRIRIKMK